MEEAQIEYTVFWTDRSEENLEDIWHFIVRDSEEAATVFVEELLDAGGSLSTLPYSHPKYHQDPSCRMLTYKGYQIIYEVVEIAVNILTVNGMQLFHKDI